MSSSCRPGVEQVLATVWEGVEEVSSRCVEHMSSKCRAHAEQLWGQVATMPGWRANVEDV